MTELSREQIESVRVLAQHYDGTPVELFGVPVRLICDMALRTQDAEAECERLREALRSAKSEFEKLAVPTDGVRLVDAALATPPPEGEPERHKWRDERCVKCGDKDWRAGPVCPGAPHTPEKAESYPLDSEGRCLKCGGTGRIGVDSTREPCPACTSLPSQQAHGDALAELEFLETCAAQGTDGSMREAAINSVSVIRRHLTASGVPYVPEEVRQIPYEMRMNARQTEGGLVAQRLLELWSDKLETALASAPADGWRSMDTAPKDGTRILVYCPTKWGNQDEYHVAAYNEWAGGGWEVRTDDSPNMSMSFKAKNPAAWMPIAAAPTDGREYE